MYMWVIVCVRGGCGLRLEGWWGTVWVGEGELRAGEGRMGDFKSEGIEVQVPE